MHIYKKQIPCFSRISPLIKAAILFYFIYFLLKYLMEGVGCAQARGTARVFIARQVVWNSGHSAALPCLPPNCGQAEISRQLRGTPWLAARVRLLAAWQQLHQHLTVMTAPNCFDIDPISEIISTESRSTNSQQKFPQGAQLSVIKNRVLTELSVASGSLCIVFVVVALSVTVVVGFFVCFQLYRK